MRFAPLHMLGLGYMEKNTGQSFVIVDDDPLIATTMQALLSDDGHTVVVITSGKEALDKIPGIAPDCVLLDLMMPGIDGFTVIQELAKDKRLADTRYIVVSAKSYEFDRQQAFRHGAHGYVIKPINPNTFVERVTRILGDHMNLSFWGCRGTLPVPGQGTVRYGGNTSCVSVEFPRGELFIFDAGSGIKALSNHLLQQDRKRIEGKIFISHPHWDHINSLPFFVPLYMQGNEFEVLGAQHGDLTMRQIASAQMEGVYFPITLKEFGARVYFHDLREETLEIDNVTVSTMLLSHPGVCLGYRIDYGGRSICYITDNEMFLEDSEFHNPHYEEKLANFVRGCDVLITDSTYTDEEYVSKVGWGHSCISKVAKLAHAGEVKNLALFHHDPDQDDDDIDAKLETAQKLLKDMESGTLCTAPKEGDNIRV